MSQPGGEQPRRRWARGQRVQTLREVGETFGLTPQAVRRARLHLAIYGPLFGGVIVIWDYRVALFGLPRCAVDTGPGSRPYHACRLPSGDPGTVALQVSVVIALLIVGWALARDIGRGMGPVLLRRMDAPTAGTIGFLVRLLAVVVALIVALRIAEISPTAIAIGASASAVVIGLAAQQTLGNLIAGIVLLSARPFRVGDRVRLQVGMLAGQIEGVVTSLGLMYTTFDSGGDPVLVPNSAVLNAAVRPLGEPEAVSLRAHVADGRTPLDLQRAIEEQLTIPIRRRPRVVLEEVDDTGIVVTITVSPDNPGDGGRLASELLEVVTREVGEHAGEVRREADENGGADRRGQPAREEGARRDGGA